MLQVNAGQHSGTHRVDCHGKLHAEGPASPVTLFSCKQQASGRPPTIEPMRRSFSAVVAFLAAAARERARAARVFWSGAEEASSSAAASAPSRHMASSTDATAQAAPVDVYG